MCENYLDELRKIRQEQKDLVKKRTLLEVARKRSAKDIGPKIGKVVKQFGKTLELRYSIGKMGSTLNVGYENNIGVFVDIDDDFRVYIIISGKHYKSKIYVEEFKDKLDKKLLDSKWRSIHAKYDGYCYDSEIHLKEFSEDILAKEILKAYKRRYGGSPF
jgi:hypothetical protein